MIVLPKSRAFKGRKYIKSVQYVAVTIAANQTTGTATITSVDTAKTAMTLNGWTTSGGSIDLKTQIPRVTLTDATTITATRNTSHATTTVTAYVCVMEFKAAAVTSVQYGTTAFISTDTSLTPSITSVDTSRAALFWTGFDTSGGGIGNTNFWRGRIASATTLQWDKNTAGNAGTISWCVVEFASGVTNSIQQVSGTSAVAAADTDVTITSVNTENCLCLWNGLTTGIGSIIWGDIAHFGFLQSATNFRFSRYGSVSTTTRTMNATVIEFASGVVRSRQTSQPTLSSGTASLNSTVTSVNGLFSALSMCGFANDATGGVNSSRVFIGSRLVNPTTITTSRDSSTSQESKTALELLEFN